MHRTLLLMIAGFFILAAIALRAPAQYILPYDTIKPPAADVAVDSLENAERPPDTVQTAPPSPPPAPGKSPAQLALEQGNLWLRRLLFRSHPDYTLVGAYTRYQLTDWREGIGSHGPVKAKLTVYYLGSSAWMGEDAEWLQAVYQTADAEPVRVEYDLLVPSARSIKEVFRLLYRIDRGELATASLALPEGTFDYDTGDKPRAEGLERVELYSGDYPTHRFRGSGFNGAEVLIYVGDDLPPLGIVRLGYGNEGLTVTGTGVELTPRFDVPPPPR